MAYQGVLNDWRACVELRRPSRMPVFALGLEFDFRMAGMNQHDARTNIDKMVACQVAAIDRYDYDWAMVFPDDYVEFEPLGLKMRDDPDHPAMVNEYLPMTQAVLDGFKLPNPDKDMRLPIHLEMIRRVRKELGDSVCVVGRIAAPFSALGLIYGIDNLMIALFEDPDLVRANMEFFIDHQIMFGRAQLEAGADTLWLGDCVADSKFLSPAHFAEFPKAPAARVAEALTRDGGIIIYHTCETSIEHLKHQFELPASAVNIGEGTSIAEIRRKLAPRRCLLGNFEPLLLRDSTPEVVAAETRKMVQENLPAGGYVFNTGEGVMATSKPENVAAMMQTAKRMSTAA